MLLQDGVKRILGFIDLKDSEPSVFRTVSLQIKGVNGDLVLRDIFLGKSFDDVLRTIVHVRYYRKVWANERCRRKTCQSAQGTSCARASCVEATGADIAQCLRLLVARVESVR